MDFNILAILIIGLCILLRVYQLNIGITSLRNKVFFGARVYCALLTLHVSAPFGGHLQVVLKHKYI
jgi:Ni/Fe-hydrogenase subunit HybB-like protein